MFRVWDKKTLRLAGVYKEWTSKSLNGIDNKDFLTKILALIFGVSYPGPKPVELHDSVYNQVWLN